MKELILIVMMFVFGDMQEEANNMTQYVPYDKMSHCLKDARAIKNGRPTSNTAISEESRGKKASCGLKIVELVDGKMVTMYATADDVPWSDVQVTSTAKQEDSSLSYFEKLANDA